MNDEEEIMFKVKCAYDNTCSDSANVIVGEKVAKWFDFLVEKCISNIFLVEKKFILNYSLSVDNKRYRGKPYAQLIRNNLFLKIQIYLSILFITLILIFKTWSNKKKKKEEHNNKYI